MSDHAGPTSSSAPSRSARARAPFCLAGAPSRRGTPGARAGPTRRRRARERSRVLCHRSSSISSSRRANSTTSGPHEPTAPRPGAASPSAAPGAGAASPAERAPVPGRQSRSSSRSPAGRHGAGRSGGGSSAPGALSSRPSLIARSQSRSRSASAARRAAGDVRGGGQAARGRPDLERAVASSSRIAAR